MSPFNSDPIWWTVVIHIGMFQLGREIFQHRFEDLNQPKPHKRSDVFLNINSRYIEKFNSVSTNYGESCLPDDSKILNKEDTIQTYIAENTNQLDQ